MNKSSWTKANLTTSKHCQGKNINDKSEIRNFKQIFTLRF
jgi:hypothetical protein